MDSNNHSAINTDKVQILRRDFLDYLERLNKIFNDIEEEMNVIESNIEGEGKSEIVQKFMKIKEQFPKIKKNILSYADDLVLVVKSYEKQDIEMSRKIIKGIEKLEIEGGKK